MSDLLGCVFGGGMGGEVVMYLDGGFVDVLD